MYNSLYSWVVHSRVQVLFVLPRTVHIYHLTHPCKNNPTTYIHPLINSKSLVIISGEPTELIIQVALFCNSGLVSSTTSIPIPGCAALIRYIQHVLTHTVDMAYSYNSWRLIFKTSKMNWNKVKQPVHVQSNECEYMAHHRRELCISTPLWSWRFPIVTVSRLF